MATLTVPYSDLDTVLMPEKTDTYQPVGHRELVDMVLSSTNDKLGLEPVNQTFELARNGNHMFGTLTFEGDNNFRRMIGFRNSYDKSLAVSLCSGAQVMVCSNLMIVGDILYSRKHTTHVLEDIDDIINRMVGEVNNSYKIAVDNAESLYDIGVSDVEAAHIMGETYSLHKHVTPHVLTQVDRFWKATKATDKSAWELYQCFTDAMKKVHPSDRMNKQLAVHNYFMDKFCPAQDEQQSDLEYATSKTLN